MDKSIKILIVEDNPGDLEIILYELGKGKTNFEALSVKNESGFIGALRNFIPDIILSDYSLPVFDGQKAFQIKQEINPNIPFILVSGTVGDERAVELIKNGVTDYVLKDKLFTLLPKIERALKEAIEKTEKIINAEKLYKANSLYAFISQVNQNIIRVKDESSLFRNSCNLAVEFGKFKIAWIGLFNPETQTISLVEQSGFLDEDLHLFKNAGYQDEGPQDFVLRTGDYFICNNIQKDPGLQQWKPFASKLNIHSCMVFPIKKLGNIIGTFNLYSTEVNFSQVEEIKLLTEVTNDISFALDLFEKEKKQTATEDLIVKNEKRFRALIEKSADMITLSDITGNFIYGSASIKNVLGYTSDEILRFNIFSFIHPADVGGFLEKRGVLLMTYNKPFHFHIRFKHKNESWIWCEGTITNLLNEPNVQALVSNFRDISERKKMEAKQAITEELVIKNENRFRTLIEKSTDVKMLTTTKGQFIYGSPSVTKLFGYTMKEFLDKSAFNFFHPDDLPDLIKNRTRIMESPGQSFSYQYRLLHKNGSWIWCEGTLTNMLQEPGINAFVSNFRDISERKKAEQDLAVISDDLKATFDDLQKILDSSLDIICSFNEEGKFVKVSKAALNILGYEPHELLGEKYIDLVWAEDVEKTNAVAAQIMSGNPVNFFENRYTHKNGNIVQILWSATWDENSKMMYCIAKDVTERKRGDVEREKMGSDLIQRSKNLEQYSYIVSHNLRGPVANILGIANVLKGKTTAPDRDKIQKFLFTAVEQLDEIVKDLNKILEVKHEITEKKEIVYFQDLVSDITSSLENLLQKEGVKITTDFAAIDKIAVLKSYLYSIFYNLISNSIKYKQPVKMPFIEIKSYVRNEKIIISFKDNGMGIDLEQHGEKLFGLYKRFHMNIEGKGLGLFMVKTQVEILEGSISVKSEPNIGTEFIIELPI